MKVLKIGLIILISIFSIDGLNAQVESETSAADILSKSLQFTHFSKKRNLVISEGQKIKIWYKKNLTKKGILTSGGDGEFSIKAKNGSIEKIMISDLTKIKAYGKAYKQIIGTAIAVLGAGAMVFGGITLVVGTVGLFTGNLSAILLVATLPLVGGGLGVYHIGNRIDGKRAYVSKNWKVN